MAQAINKQWHKQKVWSLAFRSKSRLGKLLQLKYFFDGFFKRLIMHHSGDVIPGTSSNSRQIGHL